MEIEGAETEADDEQGTVASAVVVAVGVVLRAITVRGGESISSSDCNTLSSSWPISEVKKW